MQFSISVHTRIGYHGPSVNSNIWNQILLYAVIYLRDMLTDLPNRANESGKPMADGVDAAWVFCQVPFLSLVLLVGISKPQLTAGGEPA